MARQGKRRWVRGWPAHLLPVELRDGKTAGATIELDEAGIHVIAKGAELWRCDKLIKTQMRLRSRLLTYSYSSELHGPKADRLPSTVIFCFRLSSSF